MSYIKDKEAGNKNKDVFETAYSMRIEVHPVIYITDCPYDLMDKIRTESYPWSEGQCNICLTYEEAMEIEELKPVLALTDQSGCDVIISE